MAWVDATGKPIKDLNVAGAKGKATPERISVGPSGATITGKFSGPEEQLNITEKQLDIAKKRQELAKKDQGILSKADSALSIAKAGADYLESRKLLGPIKQGINKMTINTFGGNPLITQQDIDIIKNSDGWAKQLAYMAAAGIAKQEGRGLSDNDLKIAGAIAPDFQTENHSTIMKKINLLGRVSKGEVNLNEAQAILGISSVPEGTIQRNKKTGETRIYRNGKWEAGK